MVSKKHMTAEAILLHPVENMKNFIHHTVKPYLALLVKSKLEENINHNHWIFARVFKPQLKKRG